MPSPRAEGVQEVLTKGPLFPFIIDYTLTLPDRKQPSHVAQTGFQRGRAQG